MPMRRLVDIDAQIRQKQTELLEAGRDEEKCEAIVHGKLFLQSCGKEFLSHTGKQIFYVRGFFRFRIGKEWNTQSCGKLSE